MSQEKPSNIEELKYLITNIIYDFFVDSSDFNGIPLRKISDKLQIDYQYSIDIVKELVINEIVSIQSSTNPHIIGFQHYSIEIQIKILDEAKNIKVNKRKIRNIILISENTNYPICLYPTKNYLIKNRSLDEFSNSYYTKELAIGEPHLKPIFFEIEVLDRYFNDPRFEFKFQDYSGQISCRYDSAGKSIMREEDDIFLKTFGLGMDENRNRVAVVYLRYLKDLTSEHQFFWKSKESLIPCKIHEEYYQNTIEGNWSFSMSVFSAFLAEQKCINELTELIFGKPLFRKSFEK